MSRNSIACTTLAAVAVAFGVSAQTPNTQQPQTPTPAATQPGTTPRVTVEGCLMREADVPGRKPNIVERQNIMEDYILTSTKLVKGSAAGAQSRPDQPTGTAGTTATGASQRMYQVKGIDDARLKPLLGKRVEIEGSLQDLDKPATPSPGEEDLADLQASTIREVPGSCSTKP